MRAPRAHDHGTRQWTARLSVLSEHANFFTARWIGLGNVWYVFFLHLKFQSEFSGSPNAHLCKNTKIAWGDICLKSFGKIKNVASRQKRDQIPPIGPLCHIKSYRCISDVCKEFHAREWRPKTWNLVGYCQNPRKPTILGWAVHAVRR